MIIHELKIYDFRRFKSVDGAPGLQITFHKGLNALIGENDSGNDHLVVAWDTFSKEHPGCCERVETDGTDVFSIPEQFADWGMYLAEQRVDK